MAQQRTAWLSDSILTYGDGLGSSLVGDRGKLEEIWKRYGEVVDKDKAAGAIFLFSVDASAADTQPIFESEAYVNRKGPLWVLRPSWITDHLDHADDFDSRFDSATDHLCSYILVPLENESDSSDSYARADQAPAAPKPAAAPRTRSPTKQHSAFSPGSMKALSSSAPESEYDHVYDLVESTIECKGHGVTTLQTPTLVDFSQPPYSIQPRPSKKSKVR